MVTVQSYNAHVVNIYRPANELHLFVDNGSTLRFPLRHVDPDFLRRFPSTNSRHRNVDVVSSDSDDQILALFYQEKLVWPAM